MLGRKSAISRLKHSTYRLYVLTHSIIMHTISKDECENCCSYRWNKTAVRTVICSTRVL